MAPHVGVWAPNSTTNLTRNLTPHVATNLEALKLSTHPLELTSPAAGSWGDTTLLCHMAAPAEANCRVRQPSRRPNTLHPLLPSTAASRK